MMAMDMHRIRDADLDLAIPGVAAPIDNAALLGRLRETVGRRNVLTRDMDTRRYATGYRFGGGGVLAVVRPGTLVEQWHVLRLCLAADKIMIFQSANTGLTGGSTPDGRYGRDVVLINTMRIRAVHLIAGGEQVVCLPGATLDMLERRLAPLGREPHSVIGSSCIGASVFGGICNNSGGALVRRGPAFTQFALFARVDAQGILHLVNHLGIRLGDAPETILQRVQDGAFSDADVVASADRAASDRSYADHVRAIDEPTPARFNADPARLFEASGSAGKVMLLAVRLDTFAIEPRTATFYIGSNSSGDLAALRRDILGKFVSLPISAEYIHRDAYDIAEVYGKDVFLAIRWLGTARLPKLFRLKAAIDAIAAHVRFLPPRLSDHLLQGLSRLFPRHLPERMQDYRARFDHHLILKMGGDGIEEARRYLARRYPAPSGDVFECTADEAQSAFLHRFAVAGAAIRYRNVHSSDVEDIVALDIALRRNDPDWFEKLPDDIGAPIMVALYYGHFLCHVFHQDYIVAKGHDTHALEQRIWSLLDTRGAEYPAEHNVGHLYPAKPALEAHYRALDPCNSFNPGIGLTCRNAHWEA